MTRTLSIVVAVLALSAAACNGGTGNDANARPDSTAVAVATAPVRPLVEKGKSGACGGGTEACGAPAAASNHGEPSECAAAANTPDTAPTMEKDPATGAMKSMVGQRLAGLPTVKVADLLAKPESYAGKTVRVEGDVSAMCQHRRGWFSVQDPGDRAGAYVRIVTAPSFLVPAGSIGKKARAEGVVQVVDTDPAAAAHYAKEHGMAVPAAKSVVLQATGAEFL